MKIRTFFDINKMTDAMILDVAEKVMKSVIGRSFDPNGYDIDHRSGGILIKLPKNQCNVVIYNNADIKIKWWSGDLEDSAPRNVANIIGYMDALGLFKFYRISEVEYDILEDDFDYDFHPDKMTWEIAEGLIKKIVFLADNEGLRITDFTFDGHEISITYDKEYDLSRTLYITRREVLISHNGVRIGATSNTKAVFYLLKHGIYTVKKIKTK